MTCRIYYNYEKLAYFEVQPITTLIWVKIYFKLLNGSEVIYSNKLIKFVTIQ
jgi:hypothetical protein